MNDSIIDKRFIDICRNNLVIDTIYKYKELCSIFGEAIKSSDSKKAQLKRWRRFFDWDNPTTHTYRIIEIYDEPKEVEDGRKGNGGARENSGAKSKVQEEFDYLFNAFLHREFNRNSYNGQAELCRSYFFNSEISRYFGMYSDGFYRAREDFAGMVTVTNVDKGRMAAKISEFNTAWSDINKKISEKRRSWIYNKIDKIDGVSLDSGIIAYTDRKNREFEYKDEYLDKWNIYMDEYLKSKKLKTVADVADAGLWEDMLIYISDNFKGYESVEKTRKITFDVRLLRDYDWDEYETYQKRFNEKLVDELIRYFDKRIGDDGMKMYKYIIDKYVSLT